MLLTDLTEEDWIRLGYHILAVGGALSLLDYIKNIKTDINENSSILDRVIKRAFAVDFKDIPRKIGTIQFLSQKAVYNFRLEKGV